VCCIHTWHSEQGRLMSYLLGRRFESCPGRRFVVCGLRSAGCGLRLNTLCCQLVLNFESRPFLLPLCSCFFLALFPCVLKIPVYDTHNMSAGTNQLRPSNVRGSFCSIWIIVFRHTAINDSESSFISVTRNRSVFALPYYIHMRIAVNS